MKACGTIIPKPGFNDRIPYEHQTDAMRVLDLLNREPSFSTMIVLPTGGGKTYTAVNWLLRNAVDKGRKVLWIAHRHMLLNQAAEAFVDYAYASAMPDTGSFTYRIVSGHKDHERAASISPDDDVIVASKDSLRSQLARVAKWLSGQTEAFLVVDEAHHATAKTYRRLIELLIQAVPHLKVIGLTATPFRTLESEQGLLSKIFKDGIVNGRVVKGDVGIAYQIGLQDLINRLILARPCIDARQTDERFGDSLGAKEIELMRRFDRIPDKVATKMVTSRTRNKLIVDTYAENREKYGKTILFAVNISHAVTLQGLFAAANVKSDFVVSTLKDGDTGRSRTQAENDAVIERYRNGDLEVIINVNILTEGVDLPKTQSVFLTRPTSSTIMMTQMVGRALRGLKAGGTSECYIVTFVDGWDERVAWVNPSTLYSGDASFVEEDPKERERTELQAISISMIREFAQILDPLVDSRYIEAVPFIERIPLGMYMFSYTEQGEGENEGADVSCQVMVYSSTKDAYERFVDGLPVLTSGCGLEGEEFAPDSTVEDLMRTAERQYFSDDLVPPYRTADIASIIRYYVQFGVAPTFYPFEQIDRNRLDVGAVARTIVDKDMGVSAKTAYENMLWDEGEDNVLRLLFTDKRNFSQTVDNEIRKLTNPEEYKAYLPGNIASYGEGEEDGEPSVGSNEVSSEIVKAATPGDEQPSGIEVLESSDDPSAEASAMQVVSGRLVSERLSRTVEQLHPAEERLVAMGEYQSAGLVVSERSGIVIRQFGGKARESVDGGRLALYSLGYRVAELDPENRVHLLTYTLDGRRQGWDSSKQTLHHAGDFAAFHLKFDRAPSKARFEELAQQSDSGVLVSYVDVAETKIAGDGAPSGGEPAAQRASKPAGFGSPAERRAEASFASAPHPQHAPTGSVGSKDKAGSDIAQRPSRLQAKDIVDPPSQLFQKDFETLPALVPSGKVNRLANTPFTTFNGRARLLKLNGATYLYAKGLKSLPLRVARWTDSEGLALYEYDGGKGWFDGNCSAISRDFATQYLRSERALTTMALRKGSDSIDKPITIIYSGRPSVGVLPAPSDEKGDSDAGPSSKAARGVTSSSVQAPAGRSESVQSIMLYKGDRVAKVSTSAISCIRRVAPNLCTVYTSAGSRYELKAPFSEAEKRFEPMGFVKANSGYLVRPAMIESISGGDHQRSDGERRSDERLRNRFGIQAAL